MTATTKTQHTCNDDPTQGAVCLHLVTRAMFDLWGLTVVETDKVCGMTVTVVPGLKQAVATKVATDRGLIAWFCPRPFVPFVPRSPHITAAQQAESLAWVEAHLRPQDKARRVQV